MKKCANKSAGQRTRLADGGSSQNRVKGTAQQMVDKYMSAARCVMRSGDVVEAERLFQYAEHYRRLVLSMPKKKSFSDGKGDGGSEASLCGAENVGDFVEVAFDDHGSLTDHSDGSSCLEQDFVDAR
ncbi:DUF4167 domain-containing protein [Candidatus Hydrogenosomobacter endosymbioticus]|uniref:DUF4167 domain-containing protein n=1 Tax=Candidatus Hydrogenosomobacter endosymbioticus TaxID=2558174 RepID=A0ABN6L236_9PROT|nr:DUF4167 domain-containing protein [Candidatus Hydrogenosomobacter endosymbioticus]BDB95908.1 hypothetical protein HYD_0410 [Candidatus Hydrogenosomobacter endosymbioticus]